MSTHRNSTSDPLDDGSRRDYEAWVGAGRPIHAPFVRRVVSAAQPSTAEWLTGVIDAVRDESSRVRAANSVGAEAVAQLEEAEDAQLLRGES